MDEERLEELKEHGIYHFTFSTSWNGKKKTSFFGTQQNAIDLHHPSSKSKRCDRCQKLSYRWVGSLGYYVCYDGCFSTTGHDSRTPDGWPQWIKRKRRSKTKSLLEGRTDAPSCPSCGGTHLQERGYRTTKTRRYKRYQCQDCGSWSSGTISDKEVVAGVVSV